MRTYEMYDENEYFIRFQKISPILLYKTDEYSLKKIIYQQKILKDLNDKKITISEFKDLYKKIVDYEISKKIKLEEFKARCNKIINKVKDYQYEDLIKNIDININDH